MSKSSVVRLHAALGHEAAGESVQEKVLDEQEVGLAAANGPGSWRRSHRSLQAVQVGFTVGTPVRS